MAKPLEGTGEGLRVENVTWVMRDKRGNEVIARFEKLQVAYDKAGEALREAINREFPEGCRVKTPNGRNGVMYGEVAFCPSTGEDVAIRSEKSIASGTITRRQIHRRHWQFVEHA